jgi:methylmalonyl-CoA mutase N-terminal domain/subunit
LQHLKSNRDHAAVDQCLQDLNDKASNGGNIIPSVIGAIEHKCTLGEIADELRGVFGEHR